MGPANVSSCTHGAAGLLTSNAVTTDLFRARRTSTARVGLLPTDQCHHGQGGADPENSERNAQHVAIIANPNNTRFESIVNERSSNLPYLHVLIKKERQKRNTTRTATLLGQNLAELPLSLSISPPPLSYIHTQHIKQSEAKQERGGKCRPPTARLPTICRSNYL
jgi:hypothetical protein